MRKRDKIKSYIPVAIGGINLGVINMITTEFNIPMEGVALFLAVGIWALLTGVGVIRMDKIIDHWDKDNREED